MCVVASGPKEGEINVGGRGKDQSRGGENEVPFEWESVALQFCLLQNANRVGD